MGVSSISEPAAAITVVIDVANVMGARADGWWRDRAGAALRLAREVAALAARGVQPDRMPGGLPVPTAWVLVLEGRARDAAEAAGEAAAEAGGEAGAPLMRVVSAAGSGDDAIVGEVTAPAGPFLVVTADRELRRRCQAAGAEIAGPGWLLGLL